MAEYKYLNTDEDGMGEYSDTIGKKSRVIGGTQSKAGAGRGTQGTEKKASGGAIKKMASGGSVSSASRRADGIAQRGKTKGKFC